MGRFLPYLSAVLAVILVAISSAFLADGAVEPDGGSEILPGEEGIILYDLEFHDVTILDQGPYSIVWIEGLDNDPRASALSIPRLDIPLELPVNSKIENVEIVDRELEFIDHDGVLKRNGPDIPSADLSLWERRISQPSVPETHFEYDIGTGMNLDTRDTVLKLPVSVYPVVPVDGGLEFMRSGKLLIEYSKPLSPPLDGPLEYDMLVLCPDIFVDEMEEYSQYRNQTGIRTVVIPLSAIAQDRVWNISENDTQEEMKRFIYNARKLWSIDYVLLTGDVNVMPARQIMVLDGYDDNGNSDGRFLPSDLYFSDLFKDGTTDFCSWNEYVTGDHDKLYGEYISGNRDNVDFYPDVSIGRIPAGDESELAVMLDKLKMYELTAKNSDWFNNATLCGTDTFTTYHGDNSGVPEGEYMSNLLSNGALSSFNSTKHYESLGNLSQISSTVNKGCGFFEMSDHGDYDGWGYTSQGAAIRSSHAANLNNGYKLPVVVLDACLTHGFDNENASDPVTGKDPVYGYYYYPPGSSASWRDCLGEWFHKNDNGGAVATYGCTRVGYGAHSTSYNTRNSGFINIHIHEAYSDGYNKTGDMLAKALDDYMAGPGPGGAASFKTLTEYVLLGDPAVSVGGVEGTNIIIDSDTEETEIFPNETVEVRFNLTNTGFMASLVTLHTVHPTGWNVSLDPDSVNIQPDELINGTMTVTAPGIVEMGTIANIQIEVRSPLMSSPRTRGSIFEVGRIYGIEAESDPPVANSFQGGRVMGHINVTNLGNGLENLNVSIPDIPEGWELVLGEESYDVDAFDRDRIPFQLEVPKRCLAGTHDFGFNISSNVDPSFALTEIAVDIEAEYGLELIPQVSRIDMAPGHNESFMLQVENTGNSEVQVDLGWGRTDLQGWELSMDREVLDIPPFSRDSIRVTANIPETNPPLVYKLFMNATDGRTLKETSVSINVTKVFKYEVSCEMDRKTDIGAGYNYFDIRIGNLGNAFDVYSIDHGELDGRNWTFSTSSAEASVDPGTWKTVRVTFGNSFPLKGNYTFPVIIEPFSSAPPRVLYLKIDVPPVFNFTLDIDIEKRKALPGDDMTGQLMIGSLSNMEDEYIIEPILPEGFNCEFSIENVSTSPGGDRVFNFTLCSREDQLAGPYNIGFRVISKGSGKNVTITRLFEIDEVYRMMITLVSTPPAELEPEGTYQLVYRVTNTGNTFDNLDIWVGYSDYIEDWILNKRFSWSLIDPGETRLVEINITVPAYNVTGGIFNISVIMESIADSYSSGNISMKVIGTDPVVTETKTNWLAIGGAISVAAIILIIVIIGAVLFIRRYAGEDIEVLGMEWEGEDEEEGEDLDDDWEDDEDWDDE